MTISYKIVQLHGGELTVDSAPGRGSRFSFELPCFCEGDELRAFIEDRFRIDGNGDKPTCFLFVRMADREGATDAIESLALFRDCALETLRSSRDEMLLVESESLLIGLIESDVAGARQALARLGESLRVQRIDTGRIGFNLQETHDVSSDGIDHRRMEFTGLESLLESVAPKRIMVVDDDETVLGFIEVALETGDLDAETVATTSGYDACIRFERFEPDLVILDVQMPGMDGPRVLSSMKQAGRKKTKFLAVSGDPGRFEEMLQMGCDDCLPKPFGPDALVEKVTSVLNSDKEECHA